MKTTSSPIRNLLPMALLAAAGVQASPGAPLRPPSEIVIGLTRWAAPAELAAYSNGLARLVLTNLANVDCRVVVADAWQVTNIVVVAFPKLNYDTPLARAMRSKPLFDAVRVWAASLPPAPGSSGLAGSHAVKLPEFVRHYGRAGAGAARALLLFGDPRSFDPAEPDFSMRPDKVPTGAHLKRTTGETPYGMAGARGMFTGTRLYLVHPGEGIWSCDRHKDAVRAWWAAWAQAGDATLAGFSPDAQAMLADAASGQGSPLDGSLAADPGDTEVAMRRVSPRQLPAKPQVAGQPKPAPPPVAPPPVQPKPVPVTPPPPPAPVVVVPVAVAPPPPALPPPPPPRPPARRLVNLDVTVLDERNRPVTALRRADFTVREGDQRLEIESFTSERLPSSICLVVDTSDSIKPRMQKVREAVDYLLKSLPPQDEVALLTFHRQVKVAHDFTADRLQVSQALARAALGGGTALLDAIDQAAQTTTTAGHHERKCVVLITDGEDEDSRQTEAETIRAVREANLRLYAIGFLNASSGGGTRRAPDRARTLLAELCSASGGQAYFPRTTAELDTIRSALEREWATLYHLSYYSRQAADAKGPAPAVEVAAGPHHVRTRRTAVASGND